MSTAHTLSIEYGVAPHEAPGVTTLNSWANNALCGLHAAASIDIRIVDETEIRELNQRFRGQRGATNVLSFPAELPIELGLAHLGDIAICATVVAQEAKQQGKPLEHHWAHILTHGILHLLGFDHIDEEQAERMEAQERAILSRLGMPDPYRYHHGPLTA